MTGTLAYILAKRVALGAVSGIKNITVDGNKIIFNLNNGTQATMIVPTPKDGVTPNIGANGNWFIDGVDTGVPATGPAGQDGNNGKDGKDGKSAYELAKDNGFAGTEQEWIESLVGADGKDGQDGISITKIEIDDNKHLIFTLSDDTTMDAGEIPTSTCDCGEMVGGGLVQAATFDDLPAAGETNILYLALDTNIMYYWNEQEQEYKAMSTGENSNSKRYVVFAARENFPTTGDSEVLYIDNDKKMYCWNETTSQYELLSSGNADEEGDKNFSWSNW